MQHQEKTGRIVRPTSP